MKNILEIKNHRRGENNESLVYPVVSRRARGLSVGINLFPDKKTCTFDCPYCEIEEFRGKTEFTIDALEASLDLFFEREYPEKWRGAPVMDLSISGNGEPTASPNLERVLELLAAKRRRFPVLRASPITLITNSSGFLSARIASALKSFQRAEGLQVWAKLDAGNQKRFERMSGSLYSLDFLCSSIAAFARDAPITIQSMVCAMGGIPPSSLEAEDLADRIAEIMARGGKVEELHLYTVARPPADASIAPVSDTALRDYIDIVERRISQKLSVGFGQPDVGGKLPRILGFGELGFLARPVSP